MVRNGDRHWRVGRSRTEGERTQGMTATAWSQGVGRGPRARLQRIRAAPAPGAGLCSFWSPRRPVARDTARGGAEVKH